MPLDPIAHATETLTAAIALCLKSTDELFLLDVKRLVDVIAASPLLRRCADDAEARAAVRLDELGKLDIDLRGRIVEFRAQLQTEFPFLESSTKVLEGDNSYDDSLAYFDAMVDGRDEPGVYLDSTQDNSLTAHLVEILTSVCFALQEQSNGEREKEVHRIARRFWAERQLIHREVRDLVRRDPGTAWHRIRDLGTVPHAASPVAPDGDVLAFVLGQWRERQLLDKILYSSGGLDSRPSDADVTSFRRIRETIESFLGLIEHDFCLRLGTRASREWLIRRYVERSIRVRREDLRKMAASNAAVRRRERLLVADAAAFLFDQGLEVWTEVSIGAMRLDLYEKPTPETFVVEAKIYNSVAGCKMALRHGLDQLYGYVTAVEPMLTTVDGYLLIYRLGGPKVAHPQAVRKAGRRLTIVQIDLGTAKDSGRNAKPPVALSWADIGAEEA